MSDALACKKSLACAGLFCIYKINIVEKFENRDFGKGTDESGHGGNREFYHNVVHILFRVIIYF